MCYCGFLVTVLMVSVEVNSRDNGYTSRSAGFSAQGKLCSGGCHVSVTTLF